MIEEYTIEERKPGHFKKIGEKTVAGEPTS